MLKKVIISSILVFFLIVSFSIFSDAFSQQGIILKALRNEDKIYIKMLAPLGTKEINVQILSDIGELKAIVHKDYYGELFEEDSHSSYNEFIISNENINFDINDQVKILSDNNQMMAELIREIPYEVIPKSDEKLNKELRIMTYNIHHGTDKVGNDNLDSIVDLIEEYNPDIVGLQEVDKNLVRTNFTDQIKYLADKLSMYYCFGANRSFIKGEYGNGILSKYPIVDVQNIKLQGIETRGLLKSSILIDNNKINFLVTHLGLDYNERNNQYKVIKEYVDIFEDNLIMVGDFNSLGSDPNIIYLQNKLNDSGLKTLNNYNNTLNVYKNKSRIDYVFSSKSMKIKGYKLEKVDYSDHFPVIVDIEL